VRGELNDERVVPSETRAKSSDPEEAGSGGMLRSIRDGELEDAGDSMAGE
jgi:hypothetical protein